MKSLSTYFALIFFCLIGFLISSDLQAQNQPGLLDLRTTNPSCNSGNYTIEEVFLSDASGVPITNSLKSCTIGDAQTVYISFRYSSQSNSATDNTRLFANLNVGGNDEYINIFLGNVPSAKNTSRVLTLPYSFNWTCGQEIQLLTPMLAWTTSASSDLSTSYGDSDYPDAQCDLPGNIDVAAPLAVQFDSQSCLTGENDFSVQFTSTTNGGVLPYSYSWNFGDGSSSDAENPLHTFPGAGTYNVTLTVTDDENTSSDFSQSITVYASISADIDIEDVSCSGVEDGVITLSNQAGGFGAYTYSISPNVGSLNGSTFSDLPVGDYVITIVDSRGCQTELNASIVLDDDVAPVMTAPAGLDLEACGVDDLVGSGETALAYSDTEVIISLQDFIDEGGSIIEENISSITYQDSFSGTCPIVVTRTFTVIDNCGLSDTEIQLININDTTDPTFSSVPSNPEVRSIAAGGTEYVAAAGEFDAVASDNCSDVELSYTINGGTAVIANSLDGISFGLGDTNVSWIATDECGNTANYDFVVTVYAPDINIVKTVDETSISAPGTLTYTITVTNTGNQSLTGLSVADDFAGGASFVGGDTDNDNQLDLTESWVYTATYEATQADIDAGTALVNTAVVSSNETDDASDDATTTIDQNPSIAIEKVVDVAEISEPTTLNYTITVTNTGNVSLTNISVSDAFANGASYVSGDEDGDDELDLDESWIYNASYNATQANIDAGTDLVNTVVVSSTEAADAQDDATTTIDQNPSIAITKVVDETSISEPTTLNYTITVTNTGNVSLTGVSVTDAFTNGATPLTLFSGDADNDGQLDLGESWVYNASYNATQADIDAGNDLVNTAVVSSNEAANAQDDVTTTIDQNAGITIVKTVDATSIGAPTTLNYTIRVSNTGNVSLTGVNVADAFASGANFVGGDTDNDGELDLAEIWEYSASYVATQADIDAGDDLVNIAIVSSNEAPDAQDDATTEISQGPGVAIDKAVDQTNISSPTTLNYTITIRNTGNVSLTNVSVADAFASGATYQSGDDGDNELDTDEIWIYTASYNATQADIDAGTALVNTAIVSSNETANAQDDATTTITQTPGIAIEKVVDVTEISEPTTLNYTITVTNEGNISLTGVSVADAFAGGADYESGDDDNDGELDLDEEWIYSASYDATQADIDGGADLVNIAIVSSNESGNAQDEATTTIEQTPSIAIEKVVDVADINEPTTLNYTITVTNTGNISLTGVSVADAFAGGAILESGDADNDGELDLTEEWIYSASYDATQADIDAGSDLVNVAVVSSNETVDAQDDATTAITQTPGIAIEKVVDVADISEPTTLNYTITVTNTGNVSLTGVSVADAFAGGASLVSGDADNDGELDLTEEWIYSASYTATQADIDAGSDLVNVAVVSSNETADAQDDAVTTITQTPSIAIEKVVDVADISEPTTLNYTITVTNTGNVSLTGVSVADAFAGGATLESGDADNDGELDLTEEWIYSASYTATQADIDAGSDLVNVAVVSSNETADAQDDAVTTITQTPGIAIEKVVDVADISAPTTLNYTITVTNTGNVSLTGVSVADAFAGGASLVSGDADNDGELDLTEEWIYSASYAATQSDIDAGTDLVNIAVVSSNETADAQDDAVTTITQTPGIAIEKVVDVVDISAPTTLNYTITVTNTGNVSLTGVSVSDAFAGGASLVSGDSDNDGELDLTESWIYSASYAATQADIDAGSDLVNTAIVSSNETADAQDDATTTITQTPGIAIEKVVDATSIGAPTTLNYTITITNTGNVSLTGVSVSDVFAGGATLVSGDADNDGELDLTEIWEYSATYEATQGDIDAGSDLVNTAVVSSNETADAQDDAVTTISQGPGIAIVKVVDQVNISEPTTLNYTITVRNTGNISLTGVSVSDAFAGGASLVSGDEDNDDELDLTEIWVYSADYDATQSDIDAGIALVNTAVVSSNETADAQDDATTTITQTPGIAIEKVVDVADISAPTTLNYTITVTNTGNVSLTGVSVEDAFAGGATLESGDADNDGELDLTESWIYTASYDATQGDIDGGADLINIAIVSSNESDNAQDEAITTITQTPGIAIEKVVDVADISAPTTLNYTITVTNTGNVSLTGVSVADAFAGGATLESGDADNDGELDLTEEWIYSASYAATQADIDAGSDLVNVAVVSSNETADAQDDAVTTITQTPGIAIEKVVDVADISAPTTLNYTITVTNTGNVSLTGVSVADAFAGGATLESGDTDNDGELDLTEEWIYSASYAATQADIDAGSDLVNVAVVSSNETADAQDDAMTAITQTPAFTVNKIVDLGNINAPTTLTYTVEIVNTGNVSLNNVNPVDVMPNGGSGDLGTPTESVNANGVLEVGEQWTYTAVYNATQGDIDKGWPLVNTVTVTVDELESPISDDAMTTITQSAGIAIEKVVDVANISAPTTLNYTITVTNTGNVSLTGVSVADEFAGGATLVSGDTDNDGEIDLTETWEYNASYEVTQADIDAGADLVNTAIVSSNETADAQDDATTTITQSAAIAIEKVVDEANISAPTTLTYTITVTNTGNVSLTGVSVADEFAGGATFVGGDADNDGELDLAEAWEYSATYEATQADIDAGADLVNTAIVSSNETADAQDDAITTITQSAGIAIEKVVDVAEISTPTTLNYTITVTNTGNVSLTGVSVADAFAGGASFVSGDTDNDDELDLDETWSYSASYEATQSDIDSGADLVNTAVVSSNESADAEDDAVTMIVQSASIDLIKAVDKDTFSELGEVITYTLTVTNTGNVSLSDVMITDPLTGLDENVGGLMPNEEKELITTYAITQEDLDEGMVTNMASVTADAPTGGQAGDSDEVTINADQKPGIHLDKVAISESFDEVGDMLDYEIHVTNTGNVTLSTLIILDPLTGLVHNIESLAPGVTETVLTSYTVTQEDLDRGFVNNQASVVGKGPRDNDHEFGDEEEVPADLSAGMNLEKVADKESFSVIGEEITYTLTVTNTGNVTLSNVVVGDPLTGFEETVASLAPGESQSFNTVYTVTQSDLDNGGITNVANASATDPQGNPIEDDASEESGASFNRIIANDDNFGVFNRPNARTFGNILVNDRLNGQPVSPDDVDFEFVDLDGIIGLEIAADGTLSILPGVEAREYTLRYELREKLNPSNMDDALVTFRIVANEVLPMDDQATTNQNQEVTIDVLDNDATDFVELDNSSVTVIDGPANGSVTVNPDGTVTYVPDSNFSGTDTFTYQVCDVSIPDPICGTAEVTVDVRQLSMSINKTVNVTSATVGEMVTYNISLTNNSLFTVEDIVLSDLLPAEYMMVSSTREPADGEVTVWSVPSLAPGESISFDIQVMALAEGTAINVATATAGDYTVSDEAEAVVIELADIDLSITKSSMGAEIYEGDQFDYQIVVRNEGETDASDVLVTDRLPSNVSFVDATYVSSSDEIVPQMNVNGQNVTWNVPFFPVGGELTITLTVRAEAPGNVINEVTVDAAENEIDPDDNTAIDQNVIEPFFIPNVITPGDVDNKNDQFVIKGLDKFEQNEIVIFNRWGDHVYEAKDYQNDWTAEGLNAGSYFYVLTVTDSQGEQHIFKGWIQVIKDGSEFDN